MKVNRNTTIVLGIIFICLVCMIVIPEKLGFNLNTRFESITLNILCGCIVSMVMCIVNYTIEKNRIEETIFQQLISYYHFLFGYYIIIIGDIDETKAYDKQYNFFSSFLSPLHERNISYASRDKNLDPIFKTPKFKLYKEINIFSYGIDIENFVNDNIASVEHDCCTKKEACENISKYAYSKMEETDLYMEKIKKYRKNFDWNQYKKENCVGFFTKD